MFMPFDIVNYRGTKFKDLKSKLGEVIARVKESGAYIVDFGQEQAYILSENSLERWRPSPKDVKEGKAVKNLKGNSGYVWSLAYTPDGKHLVSASDDNTVRVWDTEKGIAVRTLKERDEPVWCVAISADGKYLATGSGDNSIFIWDFPKGTVVKKLQGHTNIIESVHFSPDGQHLIAGSDDGTCSLWKVK